MIAGACRAATVLALLILSLFSLMGTCLSPHAQA